MAFDGSIMAALVTEFRQKLIGGRVAKIAMPEKDELLITIKNNGESNRLLISAGASLPLMYLTDDNKPSPLQAPAFCMLLRKHIGAGKLIKVEQSGLERIITFTFEHFDDLGDLKCKKLIVEMMGKHSNIIFADDDDNIIDSIKRIPASVSSLREVLPGRKYYLPDELKKKNPLAEDEPGFREYAGSFNESTLRMLFTRYEGISPVMAAEICFRSGVDQEVSASMLDEADTDRLFKGFKQFTEALEKEAFEPVLIERNEEPEDFAAFYLKQFETDDYDEMPYDSVSELLSDFYSNRDARARMRQKSADLRKIVTNALERAAKKYELQEKQLKDCEGKDKYKVYGDLLNTYGYELKGGEKSFTCNNYYDGDREITIPLDEHKSATENAKRFYDKYAKMRRTEDALSEEIVKTGRDVEHLGSILQSLDVCTSEADLSQVREELADFGYIKKRGYKNGKPAKSQPMHFVSSDGYDIYVGKNNYQNDEISFKLADGNDWWFHAKGVPGSHVIVKCNAPAEELPDRLFEEAAALAAFFSKSNNGEKVEVDYTQKRNLKRTPGGAPGFVIYHTNYSLIATKKTLSEGIRKISE